jgi:hypothetical protein
MTERSELETCLEVLSPETRAAATAILRIASSAYRVVGRARLEDDEAFDTASVEQLVGAIGEFARSLEKDWDPGHAARLTKAMAKRMVNQKREKTFLIIDQAVKIAVRDGRLDSARLGKLPVNELKRALDPGLDEARSRVGPQWSQMLEREADRVEQILMMRQQHAGGDLSDEDVEKLAELIETAHGRPS